ncbi:glycoside hydrolase family 9 protein [Paenibacillus athensensis]|uniref:Endoglucanase n=1 Tax=Paenibacillus athensensis TaxID=1967502 RepID=A0A4Y8Q0J6_9BACL|nr:glycoside hydrolase family 9 protein [Paenibacillus athensensis]MCD1258318.1 glycoside hydrolase family 9 protein [Paenibacillus athensensis]
MTTTAREASSRIGINQVGYRPEDAKIAVFAEAGGRFEVVDAATGAVVWQGTTDAGNEDAASGQRVFRGDFSSLTRPGRYRVTLPEAGASAAFDIAEQPYGELQRALFKTFYYFRCGMELEPNFAEKWPHSACHLTPAVVHGEESRRIDVCGGWHDAGDYGKYTAPGAKAVADLLLAFELYPQAFAMPLPLPESDGSMPDVLHECRYELEFLLRMQETESGGAFHKVTTREFPSFQCMPEDDDAELVLSPISATATGCLAAIGAMAARVYRPYDPAFADKCLSAARRAYDWLQRNPHVPGFRNPSDITTGEYGDANDRDERYWAAGELFRTTTENVFLKDLRQMEAEGGFPLFELGWADVGGYGTIAYLLSEAADKDADLTARLLQGLTSEAERLAARCVQDGYLISLTIADYKWGSNMIVFNNAMLMLLAHRFRPNRELERAALEHVHYALGRNPLALSYVTGFGERAVLNPHYRPTMGDGVDDLPVPGQVSGGPNRHLQDEIAQEWLVGVAPSKSFVDHEGSYSTNEVTVYWNSPAVFVLSHFC